MRGDENEVHHRRGYAHRHHAEDDEAVPEHQIRGPEQRVNPGGQTVPEPAAVARGDGEQQHADDEGKSVRFDPTDGVRRLSKTYP